MNDTQSETLQAFRNLEIIASLASIKISGNNQFVHWSFFNVPNDSKHRNVRQSPTRRAFDVNRFRQALTFRLSFD